LRKQNHPIRSTRKQNARSGGENHETTDDTELMVYVSGMGMAALGQGQEIIDDPETGKGLNEQHA
jgi:hypothetical protein